MGRQVQLHMLPDDMRAFLDFAQKRDPVVITISSSDSPAIEAITEPHSETRVMTLWNQKLLNSLQRKHIVYSGREYYGIDQSAPTLELVPSQPTKWNGRAALLQGRVYAPLGMELLGYSNWYNALSHWIRKNFIKNPLPLNGYVGLAAYKWFKSGGLLLPMFLPPVTQTWLSWVEAQEQNRDLFCK
jgi:hypothetical protein